jgi:hypothetical protein
MPRIAWQIRACAAPMSSEHTPEQITSSVQALREEIRLL